MLNIVHQIKSETASVTVIFSIVSQLHALSIPTQ